MNLYESNILIVDDEPALREMVQELLEKEGYLHIDTAKDCRQARELFGNKEYHMVLLDIMLPDGDGFSLYEELKKGEKSQIPVIFLSARDEDFARLRGLGLGADDYITKPFLPQELLLRMKAVLKRTYRIEEKQEKTQIGEVVIDWEAGTLTSPKESYMLTAKEYTLLKKLCDNRGKILSMNILCDTLWPDGSYGYENSLMVHMRRLREKIEENPSKPEYLVTVRGLGYKLK
ncbi:MAG: response regulator transcription factor [Lachnospiraceae bacterium]|nr:response regulator transcription factor [Lachnospiraceae bacterium]